jgi:plastocyanin
MRARWTNLAVLGLLLSAAGAVLLLVAITAFGLNPSERPFLLIVGGVAIVGAGVVRRFGWWAKILGCVVGVGLVMTLYWTAFGISSFTSFFDFMPGVLVVPGAILAFVSSIGAIVAGRRGHTGGSPSGRERGAIRFALAVVVLLAVGSGVLTLTSRTTAGASGADATVVMKNFKFSAKHYVLRAGSTVFVRNDDPFVHTFTVDALGMNKRTHPGDRIILRVPDRRGEFILYCTLHTSDPKHPRPDDMAARVEIR